MKNEASGWGDGPKGKLAGWIAFYNRKKLEIKIGKDAKDLYSAKLFAIKKLKVPKSKEGMLAIEPAYDDLSESYKVHYPSLKKLTTLRYTDPRVSTEGRKICAEKEGTFKKGDTIVHGHYVVYEDTEMPGSYIGIHVGSEISEDTGEAPINVVAIDRSQKAVVNRVAYRMRQSKIAESETIEEMELDVELRLMANWAGIAEAKGKGGRIDTMRKIVKDHQNQKVDGQIVDAQSANIYVQVYDNINSSMQKKFDSMPIKQAMDLAWKVVKKASK